MQYRWHRARTYSIHNSFPMLAPISPTQGHPAVRGGIGDAGGGAAAVGAVRPFDERGGASGIGIATKQVTICSIIHHIHLIYFIHSIHPIHLIHPIHRICYYPIFYPIYFVTPSRPSLGRLALGARDGGVEGGGAAHGAARGRGAGIGAWAGLRQSPNAVALQMRQCHGWRCAGVGSIRSERVMLYL